MSKTWNISQVYSTGAQISFTFSGYSEYIIYAYGSANKFFLTIPITQKILDTYSSSISFFTSEYTGSSTYFDIDVEINSSRTNILVYWNKNGTPVSGYFYIVYR